MRFLLVDRILELEPGVSIVAEKTLGSGEELFADHFPGFPVVPAVLLTEMMAQAAGKCLNAERRARGRAMLIEIRSARFRQWARPDEVITLTAKIEQNSEDVAVARCSAESNGSRCCSAQLLFAFKAVAEFTDGWKDPVLDAYLGG